MWAHTKLSPGGKKFTLSPDTDVYHIGLPYVSTADVIIQLSKPSDKELKLLNLTTLVDTLQRDPDLVHMPDREIPVMMQIVYINRM